MASATTLTRIGANVRVQVNKVRDRIPEKLLNKLRDNPRGKVLDYKMTDGTDIGLVLELSDGTTSWFFNEEILGG